MGIVCRPDLALELISIIISATAIMFSHRTATCIDNNDVQLHLIIITTVIFINGAFLYDSPQIRYWSHSRTSRHYEK